MHVTGGEGEAHEGNRQENQSDQSPYPLKLWVKLNEMNGWDGGKRAAVQCQ